MLLTAGAMAFGWGVYQHQQYQNDPTKWFQLSVALFVVALILFLWFVGFLKFAWRVLAWFLARANFLRDYRVRWPVARAVAVIADDPDLLRFREEWNNKETRESARRTALAYVANHPEMYEAFKNKSNEELVAMVDDYRRTTRQAEAMINRIDVWLVSMLPPQQITGEIHAEVSAIAVRGEGSVAPPEPPDEKIVILFRRYAQPAYGALMEVLDDVMSKCFNIGEWQGLSAAYFKANVVESSRGVVARIGDHTETKQREVLQREFVDFYSVYSQMMAGAWQLGHREISIERAKLAEWEKLDGAFEKEIEDLAAGIDRQWLKNVTMYAAEGRKLLRRLAEKPTSP